MDLKGKYGLIIPAKEREAKANEAAKAPPPRKRNVFGDDESDSDEVDEDTDWVRKTMKKQSHGSIQQKQSIQAIKKALADDPSVYEYDELYDDMEKKRETSKDAQKKDRKPKYIENLLKTAEKRKQEEEARNERLVQKERENEGDMYKDKEAFVTGAYRKKMEELERIKEEERRRDQLDALVDVTKQNDLSGFYRHLYRQQVDKPEETELEKQPQPIATEVKSEPDSPSRQESDSPGREELDSRIRENLDSRRREDSRDRRERTDSRHRKTDSDSRREREETDSRRRRRKHSSSSEESDSPAIKEEVELPRSDVSKTHRSPTPDMKVDLDIKTEPPADPGLPPRSIWEKRTVGPAFDEALARYFARKQSNTRVFPVS